MSGLLGSLGKATPFGGIVASPPKCDVLDKQEEEKHPNLNGVQVSCFGAQTSKNLANELI